MLADTLLFAAVFLFGMAAGGAIMHLLFGPDPDLAGPWDPYAGRSAVYREHDDPECPHCRGIGR